MAKPTKYVLLKTTKLDNGFVSAGETVELDPQAVKTKKLIEGGVIAKPGQNAVKTSKLEETEKKLEESNKLLDEAKNKIGDLEAKLEAANKTISDLELGSEDKKAEDKKEDEKKTEPAKKDLSGTK